MLQPLYGMLQPPRMLCILYAGYCNAAHALCGLSRPLCELLYPSCGLLQSPRVLHILCVGFCILYVGYYILCVRCYRIYMGR